MADGILRSFLQMAGIRIKLIDNGDNTQSLAVGMTAGVTIDPGDIEIGAVEIKGDDDDTRADVKVASAAATTDNALVSTDPVVAARLPSALSAQGALKVSLNESVLPSARLAAAPTVSAVTPYSAGDCVGETYDIGAILGAGDTSRLSHIVLFDDTGLGLALDIYFFTPDMLFSPYADNAVFTLNGLVNPNLLTGIASVNQSDWQPTGGAGKTATIPLHDKLLVGGAGVLWMQVVTPDGGGPFSGISSFSVILVAAKN